MNTEINFLKKQRSKYIVPLLFGILFIFLLACIIGVLLFQKIHYTNEIDIQNKKITQIESLLLENQAEIATEQKLGELKQGIVLLQSNLIPHVELYEHILRLLPNPNQLINYEFIEKNQFVVEAEFKSVQNVSEYISLLLEEEYIVDTKITSIIQSNSLYQATLTIDLEGDILVKELGKND